VKQPVPSHTMEVVEPEKPQAAEVKIQTPTKQETPYVAQTFDKVDATDTAGVEGEAVKTAEPVQTAAAKKLPTTASPIYGVGLAGLALIAASMLLRRVSAQLS